MYRMCPSIPCRTANMSATTQSTEEQRTRQQWIRHDWGLETFLIWPRCCFLRWNVKSYRPRLFDLRLAKRLDVGTSLLLVQSLDQGKIGGGGGGCWKPLQTFALFFFQTQSICLNLPQPPPGTAILETSPDAALWLVQVPAKGTFHWPRACFTEHFYIYELRQEQNTYEINMPAKIWGILICEPI